MRCCIGVSRPLSEAWKPICLYWGPEPFGITLLESLASSVPIVVTDSGGMTEVIEDGVNGFVIRIKDYRQLAERCIWLLKNTQVREKLGENGRRLIEQKYTKELMAENTLQVYHRLLSS